MKPELFSLRLPSYRSLWLALGHEDWRLSHAFKDNLTVHFVRDHFLGIQVGYSGHIKAFFKGRKRISAVTMTRAEYDQSGLARIHHKGFSPIRSAALTIWTMLGWLAILSAELFLVRSLHGKEGVLALSLAAFAFVALTHWVLVEPRIRYVETFRTARLLLLVQGGALLFELYKILSE